MIELRVQIAPNTASAAERSLYDIEAWWRTEPAVGAPGVWTLGSTTPLLAVTDDIVVTVPTVIGRYHVAVRLVRRADAYILPAYADAVNADDWPAASRKLITCDVENPGLVLTAEPWRRTGVATSEIPVVVSGDGFDDGLDVVFEAKKELGVEPFEEFDTVTPVALDVDAAAVLAVAAVGGGLPQGFGDLGNMLQFRAHQNLADGSQTGDSNTAEVYAGVPQVTDATISISPAPGGARHRVDVAWTSIGDPPQVAPALGAFHHVWAAIVTPGTMFTDSFKNPYRGGAPEATGSLSFDAAGLVDGQQVRVAVWRTAVWDGAVGWPTDMAYAREYLATVGGTLSGAPPAPAKGTPFTEQVVQDGKDAMRFKIVTTIGGADSAWWHTDELRRNPVTGTEAWVSINLGLPNILQNGSVITRTVLLVADVDGGPKSLIAVRWRQSRLIGGQRVFSPYLEWRL